jgi:hypothetical protein
MKTTHTYLAGQAFIACVDYALSGTSGDFAYAIICDGQGPNKIPDMDFGVRAVTLAARETVRLARTTDLFPAFFGTYTIGKASAMKLIFPALHYQALDVSLLVAWVKGDKMTAYLYGNGTFIHKNHEHVRVVHVNSPQPDFLSYGLDEARKASYLAAQHGKNKEYYDCILQGHDESGSTISSRFLEPVVIQTPVQPGDVIYLCSDGIDSFRDAHMSRRDWREMLEAYLMRPLSPMMAGSYAYDDISMATIAI